MGQNGILFSLIEFSIKRVGRKINLLHFVFLSGKKERSTCHLKPTQAGLISWRKLIHLYRSYSSQWKKLSYLIQHIYLGIKFYIFFLSFHWFMSSSLLKMSMPTFHKFENWKKKKKKFYISWNGGLWIFGCNFSIIQIENWKETQ